MNQVPPPQAHLTGGEKVSQGQYLPTEPQSLNIYDFRELSSTPHPGCYNIIDTLPGGFDPMVRRGLSFSDLGGVSQFFRIRSGLCFLELFLEGGGVSFLN